MAQVSGENLSPVISIVAWFLLATSILSVLTRVGRKYFVAGTLASDDYMIGISLVFAVLNCVCVSLAAANGYGRPTDQSSDGQQKAALKSIYAADMMYIASLCFSKVSVLVFVKTIIKSASNKTTLWIVTPGIAAWAISAEFATAFQCHLPRPWDYTHGKCFQRVAWWYYFGISNMITEIVLIVYPTMIFVRLQTSIRNKLIITSCFIIRLLVIVGIAFELFYRSRTTNANDAMFDSWPVAICVQVVQCTSILCASAPHFKTFMESLQSSGLRLYDLPGKTSRYGSRSDGLRPSNTGGSSRARNISHRSRRYLELDRIRTRSGEFQTTVTASRKAPNWDRESQSSRTGIIQETKTWTVTQERADSGASGQI